MLSHEPSLAWTADESSWDAAEGLAALHGALEAPGVLPKLAPGYQALSDALVRLRLAGLAGVW